MEQTGERLDSWKEIAAYLKRGARTVQGPYGRPRQPDGSVLARKMRLED